MKRGNRKVKKKIILKYHKRKANNKETIEKRNSVSVIVSQKTCMAFHNYGRIIKSSNYRKKIDDK